MKRDSASATVLLGRTWVLTLRATGLKARATASSMTTPCLRMDARATDSRTSVATLVAVPTR